MAQLITVRLSRVDAQPWGLRLQGGKDFGTPLVVQKVNIGSIADQAGLIAGDSVIKVNNVDVFSLRHKDAQDIIVRSGNSFEITIQRGGSTWRPSVTPTGAIPSPTPSYGNQINTVTKTSLAHKQQESQHIGCGYNNAARPFQNGSEPVKSIVNKQYNTPVGIYSEESIAETLSAQAEVLAGGVLGVNFKKNEKVYNSAGSEVLKALQESENDPAEPDEFSPSQLRPVTPVTKHVHAPETRPAPPSTGGLPAGQNICAECERLIVGVFVRIKDKNLHVDCFKCATCGTSLKNQGYFNLNNKLYCDVHAKLAAVNNPPPGTEGYKPVPIGPNTKLSASTISAALSAHHGNLPHQNGTSHNNNLPSNLGSPKPYSYGSGPPPAGPKSPSSYPPPNWSQPKQQAYAPPQQTYAPPQQTYAPPQQTYAPPQQTYAPPQQTYAPPQQTYAPPKPTYAPPQNYSSPASNFNNNNFGSNTLPRSVGQSAPGPNKGLTFGATSAPKRGRGILSKGPGPGGRVPQCGCCNAQIRGPFITALGRIWCPDHFVCVSQSCRRPLADIGFVEEKGDLYCEYCFEKYLAPPCDKCGAKIKGDCLNAIGKHYHPECFVCTYCGKLFGNSPFFLEEGQAYCEADWNELFTTKCFACGFPVEAGDRWVEALSHNYHSQCFNCTMCKKNLEGQSFFAKGGRPYCKNHAR
ncbi:PDZ and LIM domain protein Zasp isoform X14 [Bradysia coprophila]|uniref:PDZ and LIM domain protein Zasp isoform X14 n=1 Tax=Bradysia coprophila TaxID=38358 RepID=UPI00187D7E99|nr:PDZ and LIM domain protein Zasp isoform X14 [Bradysia coprophila]